MEMIERVAKAIYEEDDVWSAAFHWPSMPSSDQSADNYRRIARAAITAMLEPTQDMIDAGDEKDSSGAEYSGYSTIPASAYEHYTAMIAKALTERKN